MRANQPVSSNVMGQSRSPAHKYPPKQAVNSKDNIANRSRDKTKEGSHSLVTPANPAGGVRITLQSANQDVDERAEVTVALNDPEEAVERMVKALAQRFPPESVLTIQPVGPDHKTPEDFGSSESQDATAPSTSDMLTSDINSARNISYTEPGSRRGDRIHASPSSTAAILQQDPKTLRSLLRLASRGGDRREWARRYGMNPKIISKLVDDLVRDPDFHDWVDRLASPSPSPSGKRKDQYLTPSGTRGNHRSSRKETSQTRGGMGDLRRNHPPAYPLTHGSQDMYPHPFGDAGRTIQSESIQLDGRSYVSGVHNEHLMQHRPVTASEASVQDYYREGTSGAPVPGLGLGSASRVDELVPGFGEYVEVLDDGTTVRYVEVEVVEEKIIEVPKIEVREIEKIEKVTEVREIEKIEEVEEIEWVEKRVEVDKDEYITKNVPVKQVIDRPREVRVEKHIKIPRKVEKIVEVPELIETPVPYDVEEKVEVPRYVNEEIPSVVAQRLRPIVRESDVKTRVTARSFEPVVYTVDVFIPKPVENALSNRGKVGEFHQMVEIPAAQYNTLLRKMNTTVPPDAIQDLFVRETEGNIPMLSDGEYDDLVAPVSHVTGLLLNTRSAGDAHSALRSSRDEGSHHHHHNHHHRRHHKDGASPTNTNDTGGRHHSRHHHHPHREHEREQHRQGRHSRRHASQTAGHRNLSRSRHHKH